MTETRTLRFDRYGSLVEDAIGLMVALDNGEIADVVSVDGMWTNHATLMLDNGEQVKAVNAAIVTL